MDINDLKNNWHSFNLPPEYTGSEPDEILTRMSNGRVTTLRDRLGRMSRVLAQICLLGLVVMVPYLHQSPTLAILSMAFFVFMGMSHFRNYRRISRLNFSEMSVRESMLTVADIDRDRIRLRTIGMTLGFPLVIYMCFTFTETFGHYYLYGCIAGGIVGMIMGILINRRTSAIIRELRAQLGQEQ